MPQSTLGNPPYALEALIAARPQQTRVVLNGQDISRFMTGLTVTAEVGEGFTRVTLDLIFPRERVAITVAGTLTDPHVTQEAI